MQPHYLTSPSPACKAALSLSMVILCLLAGRTSAWACSPIRGYIPPTNVELVGEADAIVIASSKRFIPGEHGSGRILFTVSEVIKGGVSKGAELSARGVPIAHDEPSGRVSDFGSPRASAFHGGCIAYDYSLWGDYLLFLDEHHGTWRVMGHPFTRVNEQVAGSSDDWVVAIMRYTEAMALRGEARDALLRKMAASAEAGIDPGRYPEAMAHDIARHFATPTSYKSADALIRMHARAPDKKKRLRIMWAIAHSEDPAARAFMSSQLDVIEDRFTLDAIASYFTAVRDRSATERFLTLTLKLVEGGRAQRTYWSSVMMLVATAGARDEAMMIKIFEAATEEVRGRMGAWFARHGGAASKALLTRAVGREYATHHELALSLAAMGDEAVLRWAIARLKRADPPFEYDERGYRIHRDNHPANDRWIAARVIARSPLKEASAAVRALLSPPSRDWRELLYGLKGAHHARVKERLDAARASEEIRSSPQGERLLDAIEAARGDNTEETR